MGGCKLLVGRVGYTRRRRTGRRSCQLIRSLTIAEIIEYCGYTRVSYAGRPRVQSGTTSGVFFRGDQPSTVPTHTKIRLVIALCGKRRNVRSAESCRRKKPLLG